MPGSMGAIEVPCKYRKNVQENCFMTTPNFKVLFLYPNLEMTSMVPQAIAVLSAVLRDCDIETDVFDTTFYATGLGDHNVDNVKVFLSKPYNFADKGIKNKTTDVYTDFKDKVNSFVPDLIAISLVEDTFRCGERLLKSIREYGIPVVAGGAFCTYASDKVAECKDIDFIIRGEGEAPLRELCLALARDRSYKDIANLSYREDGRLIKNDIRPAMDLNEVPFADYAVFENNDKQTLYRPMNGKIYKTIGLETTRGCPFQCSFCNSASYNPLYRGESGSTFFRKKKISRFAEELEYMVSTIKPELIYFLADVFLMMTDREFDEFYEVYSSYKLPFYFHTRAETVNEERVRKLGELNCLRGNVGIEHGNEEFRRNVIFRKLKNKEIERAFAIVGKSSFSTVANNIIGFPTETRELIFDTINLNRKVALDVDSVSCFIFSPYHGVPARDLAIDKGYLSPDRLADKNSFNTSILKMPDLSNETLMGLQRTFTMYVRFPKSRWDEIRKAEDFSSEGNMTFERLSKELRTNYSAG